MHNFTKKNSRREHVVILHSRLITNKSNGLNLYTHWSPGNTNTSKISTGEARGSFTLYTWANSHSWCPVENHTLYICVYEEPFPPRKSWEGQNRELLHRNWFLDCIKIFSHVVRSNQCLGIVRGCCLSIVNVTAISSQKCKPTRTLEHSTRHSLHTYSPSSQGLSSTLKSHTQKKDNEIINNNNVN